MASTKAYPGLELWLLAGSQDMYGAEVLAQVEAQWREVCAAINASDVIPVPVVPRAVATAADDILRVCQAANAAPECIGLAVWMHTFSPAKMWIAGLSALRKPLLHLHTQYNERLPWSEIDMDFMNLNQSAHGDREFAYIASRLMLRRKTVVGHWRDQRTLDRIGTWCRAACGWHEAQSLKVARFGDNMRNVAVTEGDKVEAQIRLGITIDGYGIGDLTDAIASAPASDVEALLDRYDSDYLVAPELQHGGARRSSLEDAARIEAGLRAFLSAGGYSAFTDTFEDLHGLAQLPGIAVQRLMADGYGFGGEGDWKTAALVRIFKVMAAGLAGGTSFIEDYTYDLTPGNERVLGSHMLEVCPSIAMARPSCEIHPLRIGGREDPVRLVFNAAPGPAVLVAMLDLGDRFRMVANELDVLPIEEELPKLPVARAIWKPKPDFFTATEAWLSAGGPHHSVLTCALGLDAVTDLATIAGLELFSIEHGSTLPQLLNELRWNDRAYSQQCR
ncbi:MAG TPA: L-arabinose isomerase [Solirubrobacteraceae bacterium]|nr:L-arabinose isomerase [Solirubrobacteraceae bacterium]